jgi:hypothetical protein
MIRKLVRVAEKSWRALSAPQPMKRSAAETAYELKQQRGDAE